MSVIGCLFFIIVRVQLCSKRVKHLRLCLCVPQPKKKKKKKKGSVTSADPTDHSVCSEAAVDN